MGAEEAAAGVGEHKGVGEDGISGEGTEAKGEGVERRSVGGSGSGADAGGGASARGGGAGERGEGEGVAREHAATRGTKRERARRSIWVN